VVRTGGKHKHESQAERTGKEGMERKGKEGKGYDGNLFPHSIKYPQ
jgi:hypothetical protein